MKLHANAQFAVGELVASLFDARKQGVRRVQSWPGDFWHPSLQRCAVEGKGYGVVATADIFQGELVAAMRALAIVYADELPSYKEMQELSTTQLMPHVQQYLLRQLIVNVAATKGPDVGDARGLLRQLFSLSDGAGAGFGIQPKGGERLGLDADGRAHLPAGVIARVQAAGVLSQLVIDPDRLAAMVNANADYGSCFGTPQAEGDHERTTVAATVLFPESSWVNHSFDPNLAMVKACDVIILRAARDILKGEELTRAYTSWCWDQEYLHQRMIAHGIDLTTCLADSPRMFPPSVFQHAQFTSLCRLIARVQVDMLADGENLQRCENIILRTMSQGVLEASCYLSLNLRFMLVDVRTRKQELPAAYREAHALCKDIHHHKPPPKECLQYCVIFLHLCALICLRQHTDKPLEIGTWQEGVAELLRAVHLLASLVLTDSRVALQNWARFEFGESVAADTVLSLLVSEHLAAETEPRAIDKCRLVDLSTMD